MFEIFIREDATLIFDQETEKSQEIEPEWIGVLIEGNYIELSELVDLFKRSEQLENQGLCVNPHNGT